MADTATKLPLLKLEGEELTRALGRLEIGKPGSKVSLPLSKVDISARVALQVAEVTVTQVFQNTYTEHLEAVYIFPLGGGSAVSQFELQVKDRIIKGVVEERAEARRQYDQAIQEGRRAALLEKERDDVFTVQVGNLPPGEEVTVRLKYSERLPFFEDGTAELRLPLVVAPRYVPGAPLDGESVGQGIEPDTDIVPDASRITPPRLAPGFDPKVGLSIKVELLADGSLADLSCSQHATRTSMGNGALTIELTREDERLNRDFILRWRLAGEKIGASYLRLAGAEGPAYGMITIIPPHREGFLGLSRDVVFVVDRSGSMEGAKMASAARACSLLLATLEPRDSFAILAFDDRCEWMNGEKELAFVQASESGVEQGNRFLRQITSRGGTELDMAVSEAQRAIAIRKNQQGLPIIVVITDGQIGDESRVLKRLQTELRDTRVFTVGIDTAVNEGFLSRLANVGGGTSAFVTPGENLDNALRAIGREIGSPLVIDVTIEDVDAGLDTASIAPSKIPDLFAGRAVAAYFSVKGKGKIRVRGKFLDGGKFEEVLSPVEAQMPAICHLWARSRIQDLEDRFRLEPANQEKIKTEIIALSKAHTILTRFTAFIVVDQSEIVNKEGQMRTVAQPVEMPAQWEMEMGRSAPSFGAAAPMPPASMPAPMSFMRRSSAPMGQGAVEDFEAFDACEESAPQACCFSFDESAATPHKPTIAEKIMNIIPTVEKKLLSAKGKAAPKQDRAKTPKPEPKPDRSALKKAYNAFEKVLSEAFEELKSGRLPDHRAIEKARAELMDALAASDIGASMPKLQRFLRVAAMEMIQALQTPGIKPESVAPIFERHMKGYAECVEEIGHHISGTSQGKRFWESTI